MRVPGRCSMMEEKLIEYLDGRAKPAERRAVEEHMAGCADCRARAEEFRALWSALDDLPTVSVSPAFDASLRARIAAEPVRPSFWSWLPAPRLAFATAALVAVSVWVSFMPQFARNQSATNQSATNQAATNQSTVNQAIIVTSTPTDADARMLRDLPVLENYDVVSQFDALSELPVSSGAADSGNAKEENR